MTDPLHRIRRFLSELRRRDVYKVGVAYLVAAFVVLQLADLAGGAFGFPDWFEPMIWVVAGLGFPLALVLAWAFERTPEGVRRTSPVRPEGIGSGESTLRDSEPEAPNRGALDPTLPQSEAADVAEASRRRSRLALQALVALGLVAAAAAGGWYLVGGGVGAGAPVGERSVAVLPFEPQNRDEPGPFTAGMHSALSSRLGNVSGLRVSPSRAVQGYRGTGRSTGEIARELGVEWIVAGNVLETEDQIRVFVELVDPEFTAVRWSEDYTRDLTTESLFDLQGEISREIALSLEAELSAEERERIERRPTGDLDAYRLYVRGRSELNNRTEEGLRQAVDYFQRAIERDSSYALAWSGLADAIGLYPSYGYGPDSLPNTLPDHEDAARRAMELDPELGEAHASLGYVHFLRQNGPEALRELQRAVELKPSYVQAHHWLAYVQLLLGRPEAAFEHLSLAVELDWRHPATRGVLVWTQIARGEVQSARQHANALSRLVPEELWQRVSHELEVLYHEGRWDELEAIARKRLEEGQLWLHSYLARIAALKGDTAAAREHLVELRKAELFGFEGLAHAALGDQNAAFSAWAKVEDPSRGGVGVLTERYVLTQRYFYPDILDPLRDDPRHRKLIREINRQWGLEPDGSLPEGVDVSFAPESDE